MQELLNRLGQIPVKTPHPECRPEEMFICYATREDSQSMALPGKRLGTKVFDANGLDLSEIAGEADIVPVFANTEENMKRYAPIPPAQAA